MCSTIFIGFCSDYIMNKFIRKDVVYFMMHVLLNTYIVSITYHNFITFILNPFSNLLIYDYYSVKSACVIIGFHIYHYLADDLDVETKIHRSYCFSDWGCITYGTYEFPLLLLILLCVDYLEG